MNALRARRQGQHRGASDHLYERDRTPSSKPFCCTRRRRRAACRRAPAGAVQRPPCDGRAVPQRPREPRRSCESCGPYDGITHAMRLMNATSVLGRYLWVFRRIVGQMQHDLFHVYTVDQHILMVLRNMCAGSSSPSTRTSTRSARNWPPALDKPWVLYIAALFHDIAKGRGGDHSELGSPTYGPSAASTGRRRECEVVRVSGGRAPDDVTHRTEGRSQ
jgi:hypothetical protein